MESQAANRSRRVLRVIVLLVFLGVVGAIFYMMVSFNQMTRNWYQPLTSEPESQVKSQEVPRAFTKTPVLELLSKSTPLKPFTILLIGIDSRDGERARSDTMILAAVHPENQRAYLLSIP